MNSRACMIIDGLCEVCRLFHIGVDCPKGGKGLGAIEVYGVGERGDAEGPQHDQSGPRRSMDRTELLEVGTVTCWEITGEKDKKTKESKKVEINMFHGHCVTWGLLSDIGEAFARDAEELGVICCVTYEFQTTEI